MRFFYFFRKQFVNLPDFLNHSGSPTIRPSSEGVAHLAGAGRGGGGSDSLKLIMNLHTRNYLLAELPLHSAVLQAEIILFCTLYCA